MSGQVPAVPGLALPSTIGPIDAGIVPALLDAYRARTGLSVAMTGAGTNRTLELARGGGFDVVIVHAPALEERFIAEGYGQSRHELMANDFVIVGPAGDPAGIGGLTDAADAFRRLMHCKASFLTRGDLSGTHVKELDAWAVTGGRGAALPKRSRHTAAARRGSTGSLSHASRTLPEENS
jgi:tungstate transport system substrate-binding protein